MTHLEMIKQIYSLSTQDLLAKNYKFQTDKLIKDFRLDTKECTFCHERKELSLFAQIYKGQEKRRAKVCLSCERLAQRRFDQAVYRSGK